jgi:hypothetical protein
MSNPDPQGQWFLWYHAESDCYFWETIDSAPDDPYCVEVTDLPKHREAARRLGVKEP